MFCMASVALVERKWPSPMLQKHQEIHSAMLWLNGNDKDILLRSIAAFCVICMLLWYIKMWRRTQTFFILWLARKRKISQWFMVF